MRLAVRLQFDFVLLAQVSWTLIGLWELPLDELGLHCGLGAD